MKNQKIEIEFPKIEIKSLNKYSKEILNEKAKILSRYSISKIFRNYGKENNLKVFYESDGKIGKYFVKSEDLSFAKDFKIIDLDLPTNSFYEIHTKKICYFDFFKKIEDKTNSKFDLFFRHNAFLKDNFNMFFYREYKKEEKDYQIYWTEIIENLKVIHPKPLNQIKSFFRSKKLNENLLERLILSIKKIRKENPILDESHRRVEP